MSHRIRSNVGSGSQTVSGGTSADKPKPISFEEYKKLIEPKVFVPTHITGVGQVRSGSAFVGREEAPAEQAKVEAAIKAAGLGRRDTAFEISPVIPAKTEMIAGREVIVPRTRLEILAEAQKIKEAQATQKATVVEAKPQVKTVQESVLFPIGKIETKVTPTLIAPNLTATFGVAFAQPQEKPIGKVPESIIEYEKFQTQLEEGLINVETLPESMRRDLTATGERGFLARQSAIGFGKTEEAIERAKPPSLFISELQTKSSRLFGEETGKLAKSEAEIKRTLEQEKSSHKEFLESIDNKIKEISASPSGTQFNLKGEVGAFSRLEIIGKLEEAKAEEQEKFRRFESDVSLALSRTKEGLGQIESQRKEGFAIGRNIRGEILLIKAEDAIKIVESKEIRQEAVKLAQDPAFLAFEKLGFGGDPLSMRTGALSLIARAKTIFEPSPEKRVQTFKQLETQIREENIQRAEQFLLRSKEAGLLAEPSPTKAFSTFGIDFALSPLNFAVSSFVLTPILAAKAGTAGVGTAVSQATGVGLKTKLAVGGLIGAEFLSPIEIPIIAPQKGIVFQDVSLEEKVARGLTTIGFIGAVIGAGLAGQKVSQLSPLKLREVQLPTAETRTLQIKTGEQATTAIKIPIERTVFRGLTIESKGRVFATAGFTEKGFIIQRGVPEVSLRGVKLPDLFAPQTLTQAELIRQSPDFPKMFSKFAGERELLGESVIFAFKVGGKQLPVISDFPKKFGAFSEQQTEVIKKFLREGNKLAIVTSGRPSKVVFGGQARARFISTEAKDVDIFLFGVKRQAQLDVIRGKLLQELRTAGGAKIRIAGTGGIEVQAPTGRFVHGLDIKGEFFQPDVPIGVPKAFGLELQPVSMAAQQRQGVFFGASFREMRANLASTFSFRQTEKVLAPRGVSLKVTPKGTQAVLDPNERLKDVANFVLLGRQYEKVYRIPFRRIETGLIQKFGMPLEREIAGRQIVAAPKVLSPTPSPVPQIATTASIATSVSSYFAGIRKSLVSAASRRIPSVSPVSISPSMFSVSPISVSPISPSPFISPSPLPSVSPPSPSVSISPIPSPSISPIPSPSPSISPFPSIFPSRFFGFPSVPTGVGDFGRRPSFGLPRKKRRKARVQPSLFGIELGLRLPRQRFPRTFVGTEVRPIIVERPNGSKNNKGRKRMIDLL